MTSYRHPDYEIKFDISLADFRSIAGIAFEATVEFNKENQNFQSMLIVFEDQLADISQKANAWMWSDDCIDKPEGTHVKITVGEPCDPMLSPEEHNKLSVHLGLQFEGTVTRNWNKKYEGPFDG